jgi:hypothetical protein
MMGKGMQKNLFGMLERERGVIMKAALVPMTISTMSELTEFGFAL